MNICINQSSKPWLIKHILTQFYWQQSKKKISALATKWMAVPSQCCDTDSSIKALSDLSRSKWLEVFSKEKSPRRKAQRLAEWVMCGKVNKKPFLATKNSGQLTKWSICKKWGIFFTMYTWVTESSQQDTGHTWRMNRLKERTKFLNDRPTAGSLKHKCLDATFS